METSVDEAPYRQNLLSAPRSSSTVKAHQRQLTWYEKQTHKAAPPNLSEHYRRHLEELGALLELPRATTDALIPIYITFLDDLLPILDGAGVFRNYSNGKCSRYLMRAICLVVAKYEQAAPSLRLTDDGPLLSCVEFTEKLLIGLEAAITADVEPNRLTKIQVLTLVHLHNDGLGGLDRSSSYLSRAICEAWALSLHKRFPSKGDQEQCDMLWWSLRNLDRLNKVVMGAAPYMVDDTDTGIERIIPTEASYRSQVMGLSLVLGDLMATATKVYKASSKTRVDDFQTFPSFLELGSGTNLHRFHRSHRTYLEIWYHVAAMLSGRYSGPGTIPYNRRLLSADRVLEMLSQGGHIDLPPFPLVPYAMSMSTTIMYRALRDAQREVEGSYKALTVCYETLNALGQKWTSVKGTAKLTKRILRILSQRPLMKGERSTQVKHVPKRSLQAIGVSTTAEKQWNNEAIDLQASLTPTVHLERSSPTEKPQQVSRPVATTEQQTVQCWPATETSFSHIDRAFGDLFDYTVPNILRDAVSWDSPGIGNGDGQNLFQFQEDSPCLYDSNYIGVIDSSCLETPGLQTP